MASVRVPGVVVEGYGVAGGGSKDSRYGRGTIELQIPHFLKRGLDLRPFYAATINVSTKPLALEFVAPAHRFNEVEWTDLHGPESFEFARVVVELGGRRTAAWAYRPLPETKPGEFKPDDVIEVIAPFLPGISKGARLTLVLDPTEVRVSSHRTGRGEA